jgi:hypothetical protein
MTVQSGEQSGQQEGRQRSRRSGSSRPARGETPCEAEASRERGEKQGAGPLEFPAPCQKREMYSQVARMKKILSKRPPEQKTSS